MNFKEFQIWFGFVFGWFSLASQTAFQTCPCLTVSPSHAPWRCYHNCRYLFIIHRRPVQHFVRGIWRLPQQSYSATKSSFTFRDLYWLSFQCPLSGAVEMQRVWIFPLGRCQLFRKMPTSGKPKCWHRARAEVQTDHLSDLPSLPQLLAWRWLSRFQVQGLRST